MVQTPWQDHHYYFCQDHHQNSRRDCRDYFTGTDYYHSDRHPGKEIHAPSAATHGDLHFHSNGHGRRI